MMGKGRGGGEVVCWGYDGEGEESGWMYNEGIVGAWGC